MLPAPIASAISLLLAHPSVNEDDRLAIGNAIKSGAMLTAAEAAARLRLCVRQFRRRAEAAAIVGRMQGGRRYWREDEVEAIGGTR